MRPEQDPASQPRRPEAQKRDFSEAEIHSTLFEPDLRVLGYPARESSQAAGEYFREQQTLALRRLKSRHAPGATTAST